MCDQKRNNTCILALTRVVMRPGCARVGDRFIVASTHPMLTCGSCFCPRGSAVEPDPILLVAVGGWFPLSRDATSRIPVCLFIGREATLLIVKDSLHAGRSVQHWMSLRACASHRWDWLEDAVRLCGSRLLVRPPFLSACRFIQAPRLPHFSKQAPLLGKLAAGHCTLPISNAGLNHIRNGQQLARGFPASALRSYRRRARAS
jgi:hypothetical protein